MELSHQLLVTPAVLGLLESVAFKAAERNVNGLFDNFATSSLSSSQQVTSITQFSDVCPTDWDYSALRNLIERFGYVAGYPNGSVQIAYAPKNWGLDAVNNTRLANSFSAVEIILPLV